MTINIIAKFLYRSSHVEEKYFEKILNQPLPFYNCEYELRISGTVDTDRRIMSFVDTLWNLEVTGGSDQFEPLVVIDVEHRGLAYRAGIRPGDTITRINNVYTDDMTLREAQRLIRKSGRFVQIFVQGDAEIEKTNEYTVDFWFKPRKRFPPIHVENKWAGGFGWNDRAKRIYKESNCFMVPSKIEAKYGDKIHQMKEVIVVTESDENTTDTFVEANGNGHANGDTNGTSNTNASNGNGHSDSNGNGTSNTNPTETPDKQTEEEPKK